MKTNDNKKVSVPVYWVIIAFILGGIGIYSARYLKDLYIVHTAKQEGTQKSIEEWSTSLLFKTTIVRCLKKKTRNECSKDAKKYIAEVEVCLRNRGMCSPRALAFLKGQGVYTEKPVQEEVIEGEGDNAKVINEDSD